MGQLVPSLGERGGELLGVIVKPLGDLRVGRVHLQGQVGGEHDGGVELLGIMSIRNGSLRGRFLGCPLMSARWALGQHPVVAEEIVEVAVGPLSLRGGPGTLKTAGDGVAGVALSKFAQPAKTLSFDALPLRFRADILIRTGRAMGLPESVAAGDQSDRFLVVHRHAGEGFTDVPGGRERVGLRVRSLRVHVDQTHLHGRQRIGQFPVAAVTLVRQPFVFRSPVNVLLGFPHIGPTSGESKRLQAHVFERHVPGQHHEVGPGDFLAVLLLDRPKQATSLVQVGIVGPAIERRKALRAIRRPSPAIRDAISPGAVPGHANEQRAVVAIIGGPPLLRSRQESVEILLQRRHVEFLELLGIVETLSQRIALGRILVKNLQVQLVGPPVFVGQSAGGRMSLRYRVPGHHRAFAEVLRTTLQDFRFGRVGRQEG